MDDPGPDTPAPASTEDPVAEAIARKLRPRPPQPPPAVPVTPASPPSPVRARAPRRKPRPTRLVAPAARPLTRRASLGGRLHEAFHASPAYGIALSVHLVALLALSFWTIAVYHRRELRPVQVKMATSAEVVVETDSESTALSDLLEAPELTVEVDSSDPFQEALGVDVGPLLVDDAAIGLAGSEGGGRGRGGEEGRRGGASGASDGAVNVGLEWLAAHRTKIGVWHLLPQDHERSGRIGHGGEVARTGLAILCFLAAGHDHVSEGPYREVVETAVRWLTKQTDRWGQFNNLGHGSAGFYLQGIGTLALAEALARAEDPDLRDVVTRAVGYLERSRGMYGWRYQAKGDTDTSVTTWVALALKSAEAVGVAVDPACFEGVRGYLENVSTQQGTTGYTSRSNPTPAMTASGLFLRIMLGESPTTPRNRAAAKLVGGTRLIVHRKGTQNLYHAYYAALAMYQVGGEPWSSFNPRLRDGLVRAQRRATDHRGGSWLGGGYLQGPVLATCFAILTLETYYRYLPVHGGLELDEPRVSPAQERIGLAALALARARERGDGGSLLAAEAAYQDVIEALGDEDDVDETRRLELEARAKLVEVALLQQDEALALARAEDYLAAVPRGERGEPGIRRLALLGSYKQLMARARELFGPGRQPNAAQLAELRDGLRTLQGRMERERQRLGNLVQDVLERIGPGLDQLAAQLAFEGDSEAALRDAWASLATTPPRGPVSALEARALTGMLRRAAGQFEIAAREALAAAMERGEVDLARVRARDLTRLSELQAKALDPLHRQVMLARLGAMLGLGRSRELLRGIAAFRVVQPEQAEQALEGLERAALAAEVSAGTASPAEASRLHELVLAWSRRDPVLEPGGRLTLAETLRTAGELGEAARHYELVLVAGAEPALLQAAHLALAAIRRGQGDLAAAQRHLEAVDGRAANSLAARLERCALLRAQGRPTEALEAYLGILRALGGEHPREWWDVAEAMAETYVEANDVAQAKRFLDGLREVDPEFGGDEARKQRIIGLMIELDKRG